MVGYVWKWMRMDTTRRSWTKMAQLTKMAQTGPKCSKMVKNEKKSINCQKLLTKLGWAWLKLQKIPQYYYNRPNLKGQGMAICDNPLVLPRVVSMGRAATIPWLFLKGKGSGGPALMILWFFPKARTTSGPFPERGARGGQAVTTFWLSPKGGVNPLALPKGRG